MIRLLYGQHPRLNLLIQHLLYNDLLPNYCRHQIDLKKQMFIIPWKQFIYIEAIKKIMHGSDRKKEFCIIKPGEFSFNNRLYVTHKKLIGLTKDEVIRSKELTKWTTTN